MATAPAAPSARTPADPPAPSDCLLMTQTMSETKRKSSSSDEVEEEGPDPVAEVAGEFGRWQLGLTIVLSLFNVPCTWHIFSPTFLAARRDFWCGRPPNLQEMMSATEWHTCEAASTPHGDPCLARWSNSTPPASTNITELCAWASSLPLRSCSSWEFEGSGHTIVSEWGLVCEQSSLTSLAEMLFLGGVAVGGLASGALSDRYGRKRTLMASTALQAALGTAVAAAPAFWVYATLRALLGFVSVSVVFSGFVLAVELVGAGRWRTVAGVGYMFPVAVAYIAMAGLGLLLPDWRHLQLAASLPGLLFLLLWRVLPESPRWLLALGRIEEAAAVLHRAARYNGRRPPPLPDLEKRLRRMTSPAEEQTSHQPRSFGVADLFRAPEMRRRTTVLFLIWFSVYLVYYGLVLNLANIGGDLYLNAVLTGAVEMPAIALSVGLLYRGGRRWPLAATMALSGVGAAAAALLPATAPTWLPTALPALAKFSISCSNAIMPVFTAELYPTPVRNVGVGAANVSAGVALMLVPYLWDLSAVHAALPLGTLAAFGIVGGLSVLLLPETGRGQLPNALEEMPDVTAEATGDHSS